MHISNSKAVVILSEAIGKLSADFDGRAVLLFSGGRDSTAVAAAFCVAFAQGELHFLFFDNGLLTSIDATKCQYQMISNLYYNVNTIFEQTDVRYAMCTAGMKFIEDDLVSRRYSTLLICVACKTIMHYECIKYAILKGIKVVIDGSAIRQNMFPEQTLSYMNFIRELYSQFGLIHISPLYNYLTSKDVVTETLNGLGVSIHKQEPSCMWADAFSQARDDEIVKYATRSLKILRSLEEKNK